MSRARSKSQKASLKSEIMLSLTRGTYTPDTMPTDKQARIQLINLLLNPADADFEELSENQFITPTIVKKTLNYPWNFKKLSKKRSITLDFVAQYPEKDWDYEVVSGKEIYNLESLLALYAAKVPLNWGKISSSSDIPIRWVMDNPHLPWSIEGLADQLTANDILRQLERMDFPERENSTELTPVLNNLDLKEEVTPSPKPTCECGECDFFEGDEHESSEDFEKIDQ